jgi:hypothetical protein
MAREPGQYRAYLLRLWRVLDANGHRGWRASLEDPQTGVRRGFASLEHLLAYLDASADDVPPSATEAASPGPADQ